MIPFQSQIPALPAWYKRRLVHTAYVWIVPKNSSDLLLPHTGAIGPACPQTGTNPDTVSMTTLLPFRAQNSPHASGYPLDLPISLQSVYIKRSFSISNSS